MPHNHGGKFHSGFDYQNSSKKASGLGIQHCVPSALRQHIHVELALANVISRAIQALQRKLLQENEINILAIKNHYGNFVSV